MTEIIVYILVTYTLKPMFEMILGDPLDIRNLRASDLNDNWEHGTLGDGAPSNNKAAGSRTVKNREASLTAQCLICTGPAAAHQHYGAVCCYSCR